MRPALALAAVLAIAAVAPSSAAPVAKPAHPSAKKCAKSERCAVVRRARRAASVVSRERLADAGKRGPGGGAPDQPQDPAPGDPVLPDFVSVAAREFTLTLSRPLVAAGGVRIELRNNGEDPHNLVVSPDGTRTPLASFSTLDPGLYERRSVSLAPGRYQLWCSLESHEGLGMSVTLRVQ